MRKAEAVAALALVVGLAACHSDPDHPTGAAMLAPGISTGEATAFAATHPDATLDDLVRREQLARAAIEQGVDVELERKRAMVQALLEDEIEAKVGPQSLAPNLLADAQAAVREELRGPAGYRAAVVRVTALELYRNKSLEPERRAELRAIVKAAANELYAAVNTDDPRAAIEALTFDDLDPVLSVEKRASLNIAKVGEEAKLQSGWVRADLLADALRKIGDGELTPLIDSTDVPVFAVRLEEIPPKMPEEADVLKLAESRALAQARRERLDTLLAELRGETTIALHPELLEEDR